MGTNLKSGGGNASGLALIALPGRTLATSKNPRMLTPSEIALLQQDLKAALSVIGPDEIDDARSLIADHGLPSEDFEIMQRPDLSPLQLSAVSGMVICKRKSTGAMKTYCAGHASQWLMLFETDLKSGAFGRRT